MRRFPHELSDYRPVLDGTTCAVLDQAKSSRRIATRFAHSNMLSAATDGTFNLPFLQGEVGLPQSSDTQHVAAGLVAIDAWPHDLLLNGSWRSAAG